MKPDRLWLRFVGFAGLSALLPGFGLMTLLVGAAAAGAPVGPWYPAAIQVHATTMLMGWGGTMILGVALHFLPRLRGVKLVGGEWVPALFWLLAGGLTVRVVGQFWCAGLDVSTHRAAETGLTAAIAGGVWSQAAGVCGLVAILGATFRSGPSLAKNHGFNQIAPLLLVAAGALVSAQLLWSLGAMDNLFHGRSLAIFPIGYQSAAEDLMLFGFVAAISVAMSSRLFPLTFRIQLPRPRWLKIAAAFLAVGLVSTLAEGLGYAFASPSAFLSGLAALAYAVGLLCGTVGVRVFQARKPIVGNQPAYRLTEDPAAVGVACAYFWAVVAALFLLLFSLHEFGFRTPLWLAEKNLARHAAGAGFMTLLILSVGWKMLPGFSGGRPRGRRLIWGAVVLGNLAALLRISPALLSGGIGSERNWGLMFFPLAGVAGLGTIVAFACALVISLRKER